MCGLLTRQFSFSSGISILWFGIEFRLSFVFLDDVGVVVARLRLVLFVIDLLALLTKLSSSDETLLF